MLKELGSASTGSRFELAENGGSSCPTERRTDSMAPAKQQPVRSCVFTTVRAAGRRKATPSEHVRARVQSDSALRDKRTKRALSIDVNVVQAIEEERRQPAKSLSNGTLLTNRPTEVMKDITDVITGYSMRWRIERLIGRGSRERAQSKRIQLRSARRRRQMGELILMGVAARIDESNSFHESNPSFRHGRIHPVEIKAAALLYFGKAAKTKLKVRKPTVADVTLWIACLGGYTGRPPAWSTG